MNTRRSFIRNLALASVAPAVIAAEPRPVYHNIYKNSLPAAAALSRCIITPALEGLLGKVYVDGKEIPVPDSTELNVVWHTWPKRDTNAGFFHRVVLSSNLPHEATVLLPYVAFCANWDLMQYLGEDTAQGYTPGPLHRYVEQHVQLHSCEGWMARWTPKTFSIEPYTPPT